jgi:SAM-dependent methyltransferase
MSQDNIFADFEGDRWFERNRSDLAERGTEHDLPIRLIEMYNLQPKRVLEVGAANGFRLAAIADRFGAAAVGIDPSAEAIRDGTARYPAVQMVRATADAIPFDEPFDLVIAHFVLHWIGRGKLLRSIAEIDRMLSNGGYLIIGDFLPANPTRVPYHHVEMADVYTYKQDYAAVFTRSGLYRPIALLTADERCETLDSNAPDQQRTAAWLLRKHLTEQYAEATFQAR